MESTVTVIIPTYNRPALVGQTGRAGRYHHALYVP
jgi:hypothetical protein